MSYAAVEDEHKINFQGRQSHTPWELPGTAGAPDPALTPWLTLSARALCGEVGCASDISAGGTLKALWIFHPLVSSLIHSLIPLFIHSLK